MRKKISIFSFFSGIGILDLAFEKNGYTIVFVNEYDNLFMESYQYAREQMNRHTPIYGYHNDSAERYAKRRGKRNLINLVAREHEKGNLVGFIGGPPCPDFSVAGKNAGANGENGRLTKVYFDIICRCRPDFFLFENVKGLVKTEKHRAFYNEMMMKVQANDYVMAEKVLNALEYGVPQFRERVFMVGIHKGLNFGFGLEKFHDMGFPVRRLCVRTVAVAVSIRLAILRQNADTALNHGIGFHVFCDYRRIKQDGFHLLPR